MSALSPRPSPATAGEGSAVPDPPSPLMERGPGGEVGVLRVVLLLLITASASAAPLTRFEQVEVLGLCPSKHALVQVERTLDLPYRFDDVRLVLRSPESLASLGASDVLDEALIQRLKRAGLRPLYEVEVRERLAARRAELDANGCSPGQPLAVPADTPLAVEFTLGETAYALKITVEGSHLLARLTRRGPDAHDDTGEAKRALPTYIEGKRTPKSFRPERLTQVLAFPEASLLVVVIRTNDPPRYEVPAVDVVVTFRL